MATVAAATAKRPGISLRDAEVKDLQNALRGELVLRDHASYEAARRASFGENYGRLRQLKAVYDPTNLFRINANIDPA